MRTLPLPLAAALTLLSPVAARAVDTPWAAIKVPSPGSSRSIGGYAGGCIAGARELPLTGLGYEVVRPERNRHFGHSALIDFVTQLATKLDAEGRGRLRVADLGQPRGGPAPNGHASHQTGLDVDLAFALGPRAEGVIFEPMLDHEAKKPLPAFGDAQLRALALAASDPRVERIFVNPLLKQALCKAETFPGPPGAERSTDRAWTHKVRSWWGHDEHFHVRLYCQEGSPLCKGQAPLSHDDGCAGLAWWFDEKAQADRAAAAAKYKKKVGAKGKLPKACDALLLPD